MQEIEDTGWSKQRCNWLVHLVLPHPGELSWACCHPWTPCKSPCSHCPSHSALLVPRTALLPPPTGMGSAGTVFSCSSREMAALEPPNLHCRLMPKQPQGGLRGLSSAHLLAAFLQGQESKEAIFTQVSCGKRQSQCKEKQNGKNTHNSSFGKWPPWLFGL